MDIIQKIIGYENELTDAERKVYRTVKDDPGVVTRFTISQIAMIADTSVAAVVSANISALADTRISVPRS